MLWNEECELMFLKESLKSFLSPNKLFYKIDDVYYTYVPKDKKATGEVLQSRNTLIGQFTEKWTRDLLSPIARRFGLYAINGVECGEIGLTKNSRADIAFCTTEERVQDSKNIKIIFEVKMSIVSNYMMKKDGVMQVIGDYKTHRGLPSFLRSDSILKAIGKAINVRIASSLSSDIPIVILGNSPITNNYCTKIDRLKTTGVVQGFYSLNPTVSKTEFIHSSEQQGFQTIFTLSQLEQICFNLLPKHYYYFSAMLQKDTLGSFIALAAKESSNIKKADVFLQLLNGVNSQKGEHNER